MGKGKIKVYASRDSDAHIESKGYGISESGEYILVFSNQLEVPVTKERVEELKERFYLPKLIKLPNGVWVEEQFEMAERILFGDGLFNFT